MIPWIHVVRAVQVVFAIIILGLTAYVVSTWDGWNYSSTVDFNLFTSVWTAFLATPYLTVAPLHAPNLAHPFVVLGVEVVTMIFWFAGFIALGAQLPPPAACVWSTCHALQAATVFASFEWALFAVTNFFAVLDVLNHRNSGESAQKTPHNAHLGV
ncbi:hypothetical protein N7468_003328 [Penicillium chermesinum]|uniref:MARVEL domain-containing protein n=1 Tax=Penicillium chermesinum TaxID=63820 RepID=A0A9W9P6D5_9EURO|nr:uncharacterized protein N7468_003328 [Penicillium chermesinum]KAJ5238709.1 hypothetical protein N7468_003328 [Penicillium chermesinum]